MVAIDPRKAVRGRGAVSNPTGRFEKRQLTPFDDGWGDDVDDVEGAGETSRVDEPMRLPTTVIPEKTRRAITRNESPDLSFDRSLNPYKGCEHGCVYCASGDTRVLMGDGSLRALAEVKVGDEIYGTRRVGWYRRYTKALVLAHWETHKPSYRVTLEDGTSMVTSGDHRFLTLRGWKYVVNTHDGRDRAHLTFNDKLLGVGAFATEPRTDEEYQRGYLCGMIRGDGHVGSYCYDGRRRATDRREMFRLALADGDALDRSHRYLSALGVATHRFVFQPEASLRRGMEAIRTSAFEAVRRVRELIAWPGTPSPSFELGFLAGVFDAEGSLSQGVLRISNTDPTIISATSTALSRFGFAFVVEKPERREGKPIEVVRVLGGLREHLRFLHRVGSAIARRRDIVGAALKSTSPLRVVDIEPLAATTLFDITTSTSDFVAEGVVHHNCFARPTHAYVGLSPGIDFETKIFSKPDAPERLREELHKKSYHCAPITLGANTDPYQPVERELKISRRLLEVLHEFRHPVSIITKSALVQRDVDILADMARDKLAQVFVSTTTLEKSLARIMEPRAATPERRLETIGMLNAAGVPTHVMTAPMIPFVNDHEMERILEAAYKQGARRAGYVLVRLPHELKDLIEEWLERHFPDRKDKVLNTIRQTRGGQLYESGWGVRMTGTGPYAQAIAARFAAACRRFGFNLERTELDTTKFRPPEEKGSQMALFR